MSWKRNPNHCPVCGEPYSLCSCSAEHVERHSMWIRNEGSEPAELLINGENVTLLPKQEYAVALDVSRPQRESNE